MAIKKKQTCQENGFSSVVLEWGKNLWSYLNGEDFRQKNQWNKQKRNKKDCHVKKDHQKQQKCGETPSSSPMTCFPFVCEKQCKEETTDSLLRLYDQIKNLYKQILDWVVARGNQLTSAQLKSLRELRDLYWKRFQPGGSYYQFGKLIPFLKPDILAFNLKNIVSRLTIILREIKESQINTSFALAETLVGTKMAISTGLVTMVSDTSLQSTFAQYTTDSIKLVEISDITKVQEGSAIAEFGFDIIMVDTEMKAIQTAQGIQQTLGGISDTFEFIKTLEQVSLAANESFESEGDATPVGGVLSKIIVVFDTADKVIENPSAATEAEKRDSLALVYNTQAAGDSSLENALEEAAEQIGEEITENLRGEVEEEDNQGGNDQGGNDQGGGQGNEEDPNNENEEEGEEEEDDGQGNEEDDPNNENEEEGEENEQQEEDEGNEQQEGENQENEQNESNSGMEKEEEKQKSIKKENKSKNQVKIQKTPSILKKQDQKNSKIVFAKKKPAVVKIQKKQKRVQFLTAKSKKPILVSKPQPSIPSKPQAIVKPKSPKIVSSQGQIKSPQTTGAKKIHFVKPVKNVNVATSPKSVTKPNKNTTVNKTNAKKRPLVVAKKKQALREIKPILQKKTQADSLDDLDSEGTIGKQTIDDLLDSFE